jgi:hypothetical protein
MLTNKSLKTIVYFMPFHLAAVALTWRDINRRPAHRMRGTKRLWRVASAANTLGAVAYWLVARRSTPQP